MSKKTKGEKMKLINKYLFLFVFVTIFSGIINAQVTLTLPSASGQVGNEIIVNVSVNDVTSLQMKSFQFQINYDPAIIDILDAITAGTLSSGASATDSKPADGKFRVAWASANAISGSGVLIKLKIKINAVGNSSLTYVSSDGFFNSEFASSTGVLSVTANNGVISTSETNTPPTLNMTPNGPFEVNSGEVLQITLSGSDADTGDLVTFSFSSVPLMQGATLNSTTGAFSWVPTQNDGGIYNVIFKSTDSKDTTKISTTVTVIVPNVAPTLELEPVGPSYTIDEGKTLILNLIGDDINVGDKEALVYSVLNKPDGSNLNGSVFTWTPTNKQGSDDPYYMTFIVMDPGGLSASIIVTVKVNNINSAPVFTKEITQGEVVQVHTAPTPVVYSFQYEAEDADGDQLIFGFISGPEGSGGSSSGLFTWSPTVEQAGKSYVVSVLVSDGKLAATSTKTISASTNIVGVEEDRTLIKDFRLFQNYPNPFNPSTVIGFNLPSESNVVLKIYYVLGEEVSTLINRRMNAGYHTVNFDAKDLMSGIYIYKLEAGNKSAIRKMIFQK